MKGAETHIVAPDGEAWLYEGGGVGLATSGSGDVLAGLIAGLLARGATRTRPRSGACSCTARPAGAWANGSGGWVSWPAISRPRCQCSWRSSIPRTEDRTYRTGRDRLKRQADTGTAGPTPATPATTIQTLSGRTGSRDAPRSNVAAERLRHLIGHGPRSKIPVQPEQGHGASISNAYQRLVPRRGLEPPRLSPLVPETSASTNSAIWATPVSYEAPRSLVNARFGRFLVARLY